VHEALCQASIRSVAYVRGNHCPNTETSASSCLSTYFVELVLVAKGLMLPVCVGILCLVDLAYLSYFLFVIQRDCLT